MHLRPRACFERRRDEGGVELASFIPGYSTAADQQGRYTLLPSLMRVRQGMQASYWALDASQLSVTAGISHSTWEARGRPPFQGCTCTQGFRQRAADNAGRLHHHIDMGSRRCTSRHSRTMWRFLQASEAISISHWSYCARLPPTNYRGERMQSTASETVQIRWRVVVLSGARACTYLTRLVSRSTGPPDLCCNHTSLALNPRRVFVFLHLVLYIPWGRAELALLSIVSCFCHHGRLQVRPRCQVTRQERGYR